MTVSHIPVCRKILLSYYYLTKTLEHPQPLFIIHKIDGFQHITLSIQLNLTLRILT